MAELKRNIYLNLAGSVAPILLGVALTPYLWSSLGAEKFGILTLIWAVIGYFSLFDMGTGRALTYKLSAAHLETRGVRSEIVSTGLVFTILVGAAGGYLVSVAANPSLMKILNLSPDFIDDALLAFKIAAYGAFLTTINSGIRGSFEGINMFRESNINKTLIGIFMFVGPALSIYLGFTNIWQATLVIIISRSGLVLYSLTRLSPYLSYAGIFRASNYISLFQYGGWITITGIIGPLMIYGDRFIVSAASSPEMLAYYAIPQEVLQRLLIIPAAICGALFPHFTKLSPIERKVGYKSYIIKIFSIMLALCITLVLLYRPVASHFISSNFSNSTFYAFSIISVGIIVNSVALVPYTLLHALGMPRVTASFHLLELVVYLPVLWILTQKFGIIGASIAWTLRVALDLALLHFFTAKMLNKFRGTVQ